MQNPDPDLVFGELTEKQRVVLDLATEGFTSKEIARQLDKAPRTVDQRVDSVRAKLGGIPRHELIRNYRHWREAMCDSTTYGPIPLPQRSLHSDQSSRQPEVRNLLFEDALVHDARMPWQRSGFWIEKGLTPSDLSGWGKMLVVAVGAAAIMAAAVLSIAFSSALGTMLTG